MRSVGSAVMAVLVLSTIATVAEPPNEMEFALPRGAPMRMVRIEAGSFLMGNTGHEKPSEPWPDEFPPHSVKLSQYWLGKYEVTRGQFRQFIAAKGYRRRGFWSADGWKWKQATRRTAPEFWSDDQAWFGWRFTQTDAHPVTGVTYYEAEAFCRWAGGHLPTEAQWEKAARWTGQASNIYPWGNEWQRTNLNNWYSEKRNETAQTEPVGSHPSGASPYGCQDMAGNVWEWCGDWYQSDYYAKPPPGGWADPQGPARGTYRACRGGSASNTYDCFRCAARSQLEPDRNWYTSGFRMALGP